MPLAAMTSTTMSTGPVRGAPVLQAVQKHVQTSRLSTRNPSAFSSDRVSTGRKAQSRSQRQTRCARRHNAVVLAAAATDVASSTVQAIKKTIGGDIFVAGGNGQLSARIVQELLRNGFKVTAGVTDAAEAQAGIEFAKKFELIKGDESKRLRLQEVDLSDESSIAEALPRGARVLLAIGDSLGNQKADPQLLNRTLSAAVSRDAQQFILVTPLGGVGGGGFFAGLFGGGGASSKQPSKTERQVAESGLDFVIVRAAKSDGVSPSLQETGVSITPQGSLSKDAKVTKSQVAEVVAQVLLQSQTDVLIEVAADPDSPPSSVEQAVAQVLPQCNISEEEQEEEQEEDEQEEEPQAPAPSKGSGGLFGRTQKVKAESQEDEQDSKPRGGLFGGRSKASPESPVGPQSQKKIDSKLVDAKPIGKQRGGFKQFAGKAKQQAEEVADDADKASSKSPLAGLFGGAKKAKQEVEETVEEESSKPSNPLGGLFGKAKKVADEGRREAVEDESEYPSQNPLSGLFGGAKKAQAEIEKKTPSVTGARKSAAKGIAAKGRQGKAAAQKAGSAATNGAEAPKKKGGFLQALGIGQESSYADEES